MCLKCEKYDPSCIRLHKNIKNWKLYFWGFNVEVLKFFSNVGLFNVGLVNQFSSPANTNQHDMIVFYVVNSLIWWLQRQCTEHLNNLLCNHMEYVTTMNTISVR